MQEDVIVFSNFDAEGIQNPHDHAVIVSIIIANYDVRRVLIDNESSVKILFYDAFSR